ncbi:UNVERIFIED_CONTAM: hypothetical protein GTU68_021246 [Idotea baltica]|nr:hypothetical protein [Idotea baltica]
MGAGKTTIGRLLAKELRVAFKDTDKVIEQRTGADIPWIFDMEGEQGFRDREEVVVEQLCSNSGIVIATGGGVVMRSNSRRMLGSRGWVVYLHASVEQQIERTSRDRNRPLLKNQNPEVILTQLMRTRDSLYREIADFIISTGDNHPRTVVQEILNNFNAPS